MYQHKKKFGQHFLNSPETAKNIADALSEWGSIYNKLIEIGPGEGALTKHLVANSTFGKQLQLVEIDRDLIDNLERNYSDDNVSVSNVDFLKYKFSDNEQVGVIGNFPYNISSQIVFKILESRAFVPEVVGMFQKEVALRIASAPGNKVYGILSVLTQAYYDVTLVMKLKPGAFTPPPKVDSAVIQLTRHRIGIEGVDEKKFFQIVKAAFSQRRKTLRNSLKIYLNAKPNNGLSDSILQLRPEQLQVEEFIYITKALT